MYSRKLGISEESDRVGNLEKFNERLREQYAQKRKNTTPPIQNSEEEVLEKPYENQPASLSTLIDGAKSGLSGLKINLDFETILILGLILLILTDADVPDLVLLFILVSLIF